MKFIMKLDKDDCFTTAEIKDLSVTEFLILNKALRKYVFGGEDRTIRDAMVAEIKRGSLAGKHADQMIIDEACAERSRR